MIFLSNTGVKIIKCSRYQRLLYAYIVDIDYPLSYSSYTKDKVKYDSVGLTVEGALCLTQQIREAEAKRKKAKATRKRQLEAFLKAKERLKHTKRLESLLRNRYSLLIRRGLKSLKVEPNNPPKVPPSGLIIV